jgi:predicted RNA-binding Zn-ribbon protein involved in translation (DUF1610 family)
MSISVTCPSCGTVASAPDRAAGRRVKCPKCSASLTVPTTSNPPVVLTVPAQDSGSVRKLKECPFCGEQVLEVAKKCKHCGETIDVALRVAEEAKRAAEKGPQVFMNAGGGGAAASSSAASSGGGPSNFTRGCLIPIALLMLVGMIRSTSCDNQSRPPTTEIKKNVSSQPESKKATEPESKKATEPKL